MYEINAFYGKFINFIIIQLLLSKHSAPIGYQIQPSMKTSDPINTNLKMYICIFLNTGFNLVQILINYIKNHE